MLDASTTSISPLVRRHVNITDMLSHINSQNRELQFDFFAVKAQQNGAQIKGSSNRELAKLDADSSAWAPTSFIMSEPKSVSLSRRLPQLNPSRMSGPKTQKTTGERKVASIYDIRAPKGWG